jgi:hypothetical protein
MALPCQDGERWAVVDLSAMRLVAKGSCQPGQRFPEYGWLLSGDLNVYS